VPHSRLNYLLWHGPAQSARRLPDRPAVQDSGTVFTHRELHELSNGVAALLASNTVSRGDRVGMWMPKQARSVAVMLGASKCGAIYVPVDPQAPVERAAFILGNADIRVLVTSRRLLASLAGHMDALASLRAILIVDDTGTELSPVPVPTYGWDAVIPQEKPPTIANAVDSDPAYMLYTSGSTGTPKGVVISHLNALTFIEWTIATFGIRPEDRLSGHAPLHFDLSVFDIYAALGTGACVVMVPDRIAPFPAELAKWIEDQKITVSYMVPSAFIRLLKHGELERFEYAAVRTILFAGEVFPVKHLREVMPRFPNADWFNLYGPTETNVCTWERVPKPLTQEAELPIGRSCENFDCFALTGDGRRAGPGEEGELVVRGPGVMLGYWKLPERTAKNLTPNPLHKDFTDLIYRTGDLVRVLPDGVSFQYIARLDHMVKTRGYRVELEEIEHVLHAYARVRNAAVVAIPDEDVGARLRAAVVVEGDNGLSQQELASHCATKLPSYAIPELFVLMPELPTTSTGKVDRRRLAESLREYTAVN
jgi:amino acid adenylation domain-containing protein